DNPWSHNSRPSPRFSHPILWIALEFRTRRRYDECWQENL
ncbi:MAG: hypothetical protein, partial [Olavius algarvensis spirochete endosymbiont]